MKLVFSVFQYELFETKFKNEVNIEMKCNELIILT